MRDIEIKNNLTVTRGAGEGIMEGRVFRNNNKEHMEKTKEAGDGSKGGRWVWLGWGGAVVVVNADNCN